MGSVSQSSILHIGTDGVVAPLPPGKAPNIGVLSSWIRGSPEGANGLLARPLLGDESTDASHAGVAD